MNYGQARREARRRFGQGGEVTRNKRAPAALQYVVGVTLENRRFVPLGASSTWEKAFASVKEAPGAAQEAAASAMGTSSSNNNNEGAEVPALSTDGDTAAPG